MAKTKTNVLIGVAKLYFKYPVGATDWTEVGYTSDGVTMEYTATASDVEVEEETFAINNVITKEALSIRCNMAESSLANLSVAMAGAKLFGSTISLGDGVNKEMGVKIVGPGPNGKTRTVEVPLAYTTGTVGTAYRKGEKSVVPVTFMALKPCTGSAYTIVDT